MLSLCERYKTCYNKDVCPYSKPRVNTLLSYSTCYNLVSEKNYIIYLRKDKIKKLNEI